MARRKFKNRISRGRFKSRQDVLLEKRIEQVLKAPPFEADSSIIADVIKSPEKEVKTGKLLDNNIKIDDNDKTTKFDLIKLLQIKENIEKEKALVIDAALLAEEERRRLFEEERERRQIEDERWADIQQGFADEKLRRDNFKKEIKLMQLEFDLYLKEKYPDIVGDKSIKTKDLEVVKIDIKTKNEAKVLIADEFKERMVKRLEKEKIRKQKEEGFIINKKEDMLVSTFLEEEIVIEQQEKVDRNPELEGLNPIQKQIKEMKKMEEMLGRPIVPHRDIIESEDSDFDTDTETDSTDILIKTGGESPFENYNERRESLEQLRKSMSNGSNEDDFIVMVDKQDRKSNR